MSKRTSHSPPMRTRPRAAPGPARARRSDAAANERAPPGAIADGAVFIEPQERRAMIAEAAYYRSERRGFEPGHELEDWVAAESEIERLLPLPRSPVVSGG